MRILETINQDKNNVLHKYKDVYIDSVDGHQLVFKPTSDRGLILLDAPSAFIYRSINSKRTNQDILRLARNQDDQTTLEQINQFIDKLQKVGLVYTKGSTYKRNQPMKRKLSAWFHVTNQCNLRCTYCHVSKTSERMTDEIGKKAIYKMLSDGKKNHFDIVQISFAGGEPLLEFNHITRMVKYGKKAAKEVGIPIEFAMTTNGVLITPKVAKFIKENNFAVAVSLDGIGKYNDLQRVFTDGGPTFKYIEKGIKLLQDENISVHMLTTITKHNVAHLPALFEWCYKNNIAFGTNLFRDNPCAKDLELTLNEDEAIVHLKKAFRQAYEKVLEVKDQTFFYKTMNTILDRVQISRAHDRACGIGFSYMTITHKGQIASCPMTISDPIGSLNDADIVDTMVKKSFTYKQKEIIEISNKCKTCKWKHICCGGCPLAFRLQGSKESNTPDYCKLYKTLIPYLLKIEARRLIRWGW